MVATRCTKNNTVVLGGVSGFYPPISRAHPTKTNSAFLYNRSVEIQGLLGSKSPDANDPVSNFQVFSNPEYI